MGTQQKVKILIILLLLLVSTVYLLVSQSESLEICTGSGLLLQRFTMSRHLHGFSKVRTFLKAKVIFLKSLEEVTGRTVYPKDEFSSQSLKSPF